MNALKETKKKHLLAILKYLYQFFYQTPEVVYKKYALISLSLNN